MTHVEGEVSAVSQGLLGPWPPERSAGERESGRPEGPGSQHYRREFGRA